MKLLIRVSVVVVCCFLVMAVAIYVIEYEHEEE